MASSTAEDSSGVAVGTGDDAASASRFTADRDWIGFIVPEIDMDILLFL